MLTTIETQEQKLYSLLELVIDSPTEENKLEYLTALNELEYSILEESQKYIPKSPENLNIRREAFATRPKYAKLMLEKWVAKYKTTKDCPHSYQDTLNIPFQQIKQPHSVK